MVGRILKKNRDLKPDTLRDIGEFGLIKRIAGRSGKGNASVLVGIGDDAALIKAGAQHAVPVLVTTDSLVEDIHFRKQFPPEYLGWKSLAVNISDIAAMGGVPRHYLLSLSIPGDLSSEYLDRLCAGMTNAARKYGLSLIGGDTTSSPDRIYISVTVIGVPSKNVLLRKGALPGDAIFVTGTLGDSALGLRILEESGKSLYPSLDRRRQGGGSEPRTTANLVSRLVERHLKPVPRVKEGIFFAESGMVTSMIDISDGLLADLGHICEESMVGGRVWINKVPLSPGFRAMSERYGGIGLALSGGEDYELLFTVAGDDVGRFLDRAGGMKLTRVGEIVKKKGLEITGDDGAMHVTENRGYEHFRV